MSIEYKIGFRTVECDDRRVCGEETILNSKHFVSVSIDDPTRCEFFNGIQPGIFVEGGVARNLALMTVSEIDPANIPGTLDIDLLTVVKPRVYYRGREQPVESRRVVTPKGDLWGSLFLYLNAKHFGLDQVLVGRLHPNQLPTLYLTPQAVEDYTHRQIRVSGGFDGIVIDELGRIKYISPKAVLRASLLMAVLSDHNFECTLDQKVAKSSLKDSWSDPIVKTALKDFATRAELLGIKDEFCLFLRRLGFTIPRKLLVSEK